MRALIVEDDQTIAAFLAKGLREAGFAVDHAPDGDAGVHQATTVPYDVAVVDLSTQTVVARIKAGDSPWGAVFVP